MTTMIVYYTQSLHSGHFQLSDCVAVAMPLKVFDLVAVHHH